jgi:hypothetical protein
VRTVANATIALEFDTTPQKYILGVTDEQYDVIKYYPMPGRSWRLTGTFKF